VKLLFLGLRLRAPAVVEIPPFPGPGISLGGVFCVVGFGVFGLFCFWVGVWVVLGGVVGFTPTVLSPRCRPSHRPTP